MANLVSRWLSCAMVIALAIAYSLISNRLNTHPPQALQLFSRQLQLWDEVELQHVCAVNVCGIRDRNDTFLQQVRGRFDRYTNDSTDFLKIIQEDMPVALSSNSCSKFIHSDRRAVQQSAMLSRSISVMSGVTSSDLLSSNIRQNIRRSTASATSRFSSRVTGVVKRFWYNPYEGIKSSLRFKISDGEAQHIHDQIGITLLAMRKCGRTISEMDRGLERLLQSIEETVGPHDDVVAYLATALKPWGHPDTVDRLACTHEHVEAMRRYHEGLTNMVLRYD